MKWLEPFFASQEYAPVEIATRLHHGYLVADAKLQQIFAPADTRIIRLDFGEPEPIKIERLPVLIVKPEVVDREPQPGRWGDAIRVRDTLRIEYKEKKFASLPYDEPGIATLVNYIVGVGISEGARQLTYTPAGKTQARPFARRVETPTVSVEGIEIPGTEKIIFDYHIDFEYSVSLLQNGWQAEAETRNP